MMTTMRREQVIAKIITVIGILIFSITVLVPLYWVLITSIKQEAEVYASPPTIWPNKATLTHYFDLITRTPMLIYYRNSIIVTTIVTIIALIISCLAAYSTSRLKFKGRWLLAKAVLIIYLIPSSLLFIPLFIFITQLRLNNTLLSLILVYPMFALPFMTWLLIGYFSTIPVEIEEAALIDGCTRINVLIRVVIPLAIPGILTVAIYAFTLAWNELLYAMTFINSEKSRTLPLGLTEMLTGDVYQWGRLMASAVLMSIPVILLYMFFQRYVVQGLTAGGVKA